MVDGKSEPKLGRELVSADERIQVQWQADDKRHTIYIKVRDKEGKLILVGNPVYIEVTH